MRERINLVASLSNGYLIFNTIAGNQFAFFRAPYFDPAVLTAAEAAKQTFTIGELFTNGQFVAPAPLFTGPVDVVDGEFDLPFCQSSCLVPSNKADAVLGLCILMRGRARRAILGVELGMDLIFTMSRMRFISIFLGLLLGMGSRC